MKRSRSFESFCETLVSVLVCFSSVGCGGGSPPNDATTVASPTAAPQAPTAPFAPPSASAAATSAEPPAPVPSAATEPAPSEESVPKRSLSDRLFAPTIAYMLNYAASPAKDKVTAACTAKSGEDPAAMAACVEKERGKLVSDVLVFEKKDKSTTWTTYKRTGNQLTEVGSVQIDVASDSPEKIEFKIKSEKGNRQLFAGKKLVVISSESDSSVSLDDPLLGKLIYDARIGLMSTTQ